MGDVIDVLSAAHPNDVADLVKSIRDTPLAAPVIDPLADLRGWLNALDDESREILLRTMVYGDSTDRAAQEMRLPGRYVRIRSEGIAKELTTWVASNSGRSVRWALFQLAEGLGTFASDADLPRDECQEEFALLLHLADLVWDQSAGYVRKYGFELLRGDDLPRLGTYLIDEESARAQIEGYGVRPEQVDVVFERMKLVNRSGRLVAWPADVIDQCVALLEVEGGPLETVELIRRLEAPFGERWVLQHLYADPRVMRSSDSAVALVNLEPVASARRSEAQPPVLEATPRAPEATPRLPGASRVSEPEPAPIPSSPAPTVHTADNPTSPPDGNATDSLGARLIASDEYVARRESLGRVVIRDDQVRALIDALGEAAGHRLTPAQASAALGVGPAELNGALTQVQQLLTVDGYQVVHLGADNQTVMLDDELLLDLFEVE